MSLGLINLIFERFFGISPIKLLEDKINSSNEERSPIFLGKGLKKAQKVDCHLNHFEQSSGTLGVL